MKKSVKLTMSVVLIALFAGFAFAQDPPPRQDNKAAPPAPKVSPCPKVSVKTPTPQLVREGTPVAFIAEITGGDPNVAPTIIWSVTAGMITAGQGARRIVVDSTGAGRDRQMSAELWIGGYAPECGNTAGATVKVIAPAILIDQFGDLPAEQENERITAAAEALSRTNDRLVLIAYAGRTNVRGYAVSVLRRMIAKFEKNETAANRIRAVDGGFREKPAYELWIVPEGAESPRPTPTVDRREIVYPRSTPTRKP